MAEITAICEYVEDKHPEPALVGTTAEEKANTRMWTRRVDLNICEPLAGRLPLRRRLEDVPGPYALHSPRPQTG